MRFENKAGIKLKYKVMRKLKARIRESFLL